LGSDFSGALYGCLELADQIKAAKQIPPKITRGAEKRQPFYMILIHPKKIHIL
jgi:hypothetical protein